MAAFGSPSIHSIIERLLYFPRRSESLSLIATLGVRSPVARIFGEPDRISAAEVDAAWLQRVELRSSKEVIGYLDACKFRSDAEGELAALFLDERCGLICRKQLGTAAPRDADPVVREILRIASGCHAHGIILATRDSTGGVARSRQCRELTMRLLRKGEAIEVYLLNHLVLTSAGWKKMFAIQEQVKL